MTLWDQHGNVVDLGREIGRGGEGAVYEISASSDRVAKLYHEPVSPLKVAKLTAMTGGATDDLIKIAAWPISTLHRQRGGQLAGIVMPRVSGFRDIHRLYSPAQRKLTFPKVDWSFLVHTARNLAFAFDVIHRHGHVIADVNQGNVLVSDQAIVKLIDCDSFQIATTSQVYFCDVGVPHFTPPELQGRSFEQLPRTPNHDSFGLAVTCFHLLFMGRHPFAGRFHGNGDMPIEKAIAELRFAFSPTAASRQMTPPPNALRLAHLSLQLAAMFERAFSMAGTAPAGRPSPKEWFTAFEGLKKELQQCSAYPGHKYHRALSACPWCEIERAGGPDFFISVTIGARLHSTFDLNAIWATITKVSPPPARNYVATALSSSPSPAPTALPNQITRRRRLAAGTGILALIVAVAAVLSITPTGVGWLAFVLGAAWMILRNDSALVQERNRRRQLRDSAKGAFDNLRAQWEREVGQPIDQFNTRRAELERLRQQYLALPSAYQRARADLNSNREQLQRQKYLDQFFIETSSIKGIGRGLKTTLRSYGIETAADISASAVDKVPGFGPSRVRDLVAWRVSIEQTFRFDPSKGVDPADIAAVERKFAAQRQSIEHDLAAGLSEFRRLSATASSSHQSLATQLLTLWDVLAQREADLRVA